jgi:hypothetical protein
MKISDTSKRTLTIVLENAEIEEIQAICRGYMVAYPGHVGSGARGIAGYILKSLEVDS